MGLDVCLISCGVNWQRCSEMQTHSFRRLHFLCFDVQKQPKLLPFTASTQHFFTHLPKFLFQNTLSQHEAEKVGTLVAFCLLFYPAYFIVCLFFIISIFYFLLQ